ncbi:MAG: NAD(P)/FAD-dependent oxidoreductase [Syntrophomonadaceae bacterium]|jgi:NAD(P)H-nitrite reductase large subunit|nr:NAD(P)/FAD-dependent oxidoreductase [Syntrophomonadaceae bacterium]
MKYLIVGNGIAACGAVEGIRNKDKNGEITIIDGEKRGAYTRPLISYYLSDPDAYRDINYRSPNFFREQQVKVVPAQALHIDPALQRLTLDDGRQLSYDKLLLATGSRPVQLPIPGAEQAWVKNFYTLQEAEEIQDELEKVQQAVIVGSGLIGMKAAEALYKRGRSVQLLEKESRILPRQLSPGPAGFLQTYLSKQGWDIILGEEVTLIHPDHKVELKSHRLIPADLVIIAAGTRPQLELARQAQLQVNRGIVIDSYFRTSDDNIYAAGDVAETMNITSGKPELMALLPHAHQEGYLAGCNMAGYNSPDTGNILMNSLRLLGWNICSAGALEDQEADLLSWGNKEQLLELKIKDNFLRGYVAINVPEVVGPLTNAIRHKISIPAGGWEEFINQGPSLKNIPLTYWQELRRIETYGSD